MTNLSELNGASQAQAASMIEPLIERAPEVAGRVALHRPFDDCAALDAAIRSELIALDEVGKVALFRAHPELSPDNPMAMTLASQSEQGRLNLTSQSHEYRAVLPKLNAAYRAKFGFPFITALVLHEDMQSVLAEFEMRLVATRDQEIQRAIDQICHVSAARVRIAFGGGISVPRQADVDG